MSDLATKMVVSAANVTRVAQSLAAKGLVVRQRAEHSDREVLARLTPDGEALFQKHFPRAAAFMSSLIAHLAVVVRCVRLYGQQRWGARHPQRRATVAMARVTAPACAACSRRRQRVHEGGSRVRQDGASAAGPDAPHHPHGV